MRRNRVFRSRRKRLGIYPSAKEQCVQMWKEEVADLPEPRQGVGYSGVEEQAGDLSECKGTGCSGVEGTG